MSIFTKIAKLFTTVLSDVEKVAHYISPQIEADLKAFSATLPSAVTSLDVMADQAIKLAEDVVGVQISKSIALVVAQKVFTENKKTVLAEAKALLAKLGIK